jgi:flavin reductase (DIM6/NTAB) family NADH-FMN oxidoreductase RutF
MKRSFGARAVAYPLPVFVAGTYDRTGKPNAMVAAGGVICSSDPLSMRFRSALHAARTGT